MAKIVVLTVLYLCSYQSIADADLKNLFDPNYKSIIYLGMDFSKSVFIGDFSEALGVDGDPNVKNAYFKAWNNLVTGEFEKYDIKAMVSNKNISTNLETVTSKNNASKLSELIGSKEPEYSENEIQDHLFTYKTNYKQGLGVVLLVEVFNKETEKAIVDFIVIDLSNNKIVLIKKVEGRPRGFGLRNYWAGAIYEVMKSIERSFKTDWKYSLLNN